MANKRGVSANDKAVDVAVGPRELGPHAARVSRAPPPHRLETSHCSACAVDLGGMSVVARC
jgi:hypothetical protein